MFRHILRSNDYTLVNIYLVFAINTLSDNNIFERRLSGSRNNLSLLKTSVNVKFNSKI